MDIRTALERRVYYARKRELENLLAVRDRLSVRLMETRIQSRLPELEVDE